MAQRCWRNLGVHWEFATVGDEDFLGGGAAAAADAFNGSDNIHALADPAENDVAAIEPCGLDGADEELGAVGVRASVGHGKDAFAGVLELEVLVLELFAVDGFAASAGAVGEVAALEHELRDDAVELGALVGKRLAGLAHALLARAERSEVLNRLRHRLAVKVHGDAPGVLSIDVDVKVHLVGDLRALGRNSTDQAESDELGEH